VGTTKDTDRGESLEPPVAILLGAGFSHAVDSAYPLTDDLGNLVRSRLDEHDRAMLPPGEFKRGRFEEWLSYLSESQPHLNPEQIAGASALSLRITRTIQEVLTDLQDEALNSGVPKEWFWQFLSVLHVLRAQVATLNYDNLVECGVNTLRLESPGWFGATTVVEDDLLAGLPPCASFPGVELQSTSLTTYDGLVPSMSERRRNTFKLWKLHGSLTWYWLPDGGGGSTLRRWRLPGTFGELWDQEEGQRRQELPAHEVFVVPPAALKGQRLREPATRQIWFEAARALATATRVVLMGYSLPQDDHSVTGMLAEALMGRDVLVEVVNRCPTPVVDRLDRLGVPKSLVSVTDGDNCIAKWTSAEVSRLSALAVGAIRFDQRLTGEVLVYGDAPRVDRFRSYSAPDGRDGQLVLHMDPHTDPSGLQNTRPVLLADFSQQLDSAGAITIECEGKKLPVIGHWVRIDTSGALMTQLHLVTARS
jgi:hypothetical protein